jgi:hypothetical protein
MATETYNVIGKEDQVEAMLALCPCKMVEKFPCEHPCLDINIEVQTEDVNDVVGFCEDNDLEYELVLGAREGAS